MTRASSPNGRPHVYAGDRVNTPKGPGTVRLVAADLGLATVELDTGGKKPFALNTLVLVPSETR